MTVVRHAVPAPAREPVRALSAAQAVPPQLTILAGLAVLLSRSCGQDDLVIGLPARGTSGLDVTRTAGCLTELVPVRIGVPAAASFRQFVTELQRSGRGRPQPLRTGT